MKNQLIPPITPLKNKRFYNHNGSIIFYSSKEEKPVQQLTCGYRRIVIGKRGPYLEFNRDQILMDQFSIPDNQKWRLSDKWKNKVYYIEYRSINSNIMLYQQLKTVKYADYKINKFYISPWDLLIWDIKKERFCEITKGSKPKHHL